MIKIRYRDPNELSPGLHAAAERHGRGTTVYLLSGLTPAERRAALRRLRLSARMGYCPRLPAAQLVLAMFADRIRTGVGQAGAIFRSHPAGSTVPVMVVSAGAVAFLLFSTVSIRVLPPPRTTDQLPPSFLAPSVSAIAEPGPGSPQSPVAGAGRHGSFGSEIRQLTSAHTGSAGAAGFGATTIAGFGTSSGSGAAVGTADGTGTTSTTTSGSTGSSGSGTGSTSGSSVSGPSPSPGGSSPGGARGSGSGSGGGTTGSGNPGSTPAPAPGATSAAASTPAATPSPAATQPTGAASSGSGLCLDVGPLGVCLDL